MAGDNNKVLNRVLEAIDIMTNEAMSKLDYDKTIKAKIIDNSMAPTTGFYTCDDGSTRFQARSDNSYRIGTYVYITVPNGNYNNDKFIIGECSADDINTHNYIPLSQKFVEITDNLVDGSNKIGLIANGEVEEKSLWASNKTYLGYDILAFGANFTTLLREFNPRPFEGEYGIKLEIKAVPYRSDNEKLITLLFNVNDMSGNVYSFSSGSYQTKLFDMSGYREIRSISATLYQVAGSFKDRDGGLIPVADAENIFADNLSITLGYNINSFKEDGLLLYTFSDEYYDYETANVEKDLKLSWIKLGSDGSYKVVDEPSEIDDTSEIVWFRYNADPNVEDDLAGLFWERIDDFKNQFRVSFTPSATKQEENIKVMVQSPTEKQIAEEWTAENYETIKSLPKSYQFQIEQVLDKTITGATVLQRIEYLISLIPEKEEDRSESQKKELEQLELFNSLISSIVDRANKITCLYSNTLVFKNKQEVPNNSTLDLLNALKLDFSQDEMNGIYNIYDETGSLKNSGEKVKNRIVKAYLNSKTLGVIELDDTTSVEWFVPLDDTMIEQSENNEISYILVDYNTYDCDFLPANVNYAKYDGGPQFSFCIAENYYSQKVNNTIYCKVIRNGFTYIAHQELVFGTTGTNGTDVSFRLSIYQGSETGEIEKNPAGLNELYPDNVLTYGDNIIIVPTMFDYNHKDITEETLWSTDNHGEKKSRIEYSWYSYSNWLKNPNDENSDKALTIQANTDGSATIYATAGANFEDCKYFVLQASVYYKGAKLSSLIPIPVRIDKEYSFIGPDKIIYNSLGNDAIYNKGVFETKTPNENSAIKYEISINGAVDNKIKNYYPSIQKSSNGQSYLLAGKLYFINGDFCGIDVYENNKLVWIQPLLIHQNRYGSALLNEWDGNLTIDENNGIILSSMVGAGQKNSDNSYSGVLMGTVKRSADEGTGTGLYGINKGILSFGFDIDGTAFLGKSGSGQIKFDGNKGVIESANFRTDSGNGSILHSKNEEYINGSGMRIDLDDNVFESYGDAGSIVFDLAHKMDGKSHPMFVISGQYINLKERENKPLFYVGKKNVSENEEYLQTKKRYLDLKDALEKYKVEESYIEQWKKDIFDYLSEDNKDRTLLEIDSDFGKYTNTLEISKDLNIPPGSVQDFLNKNRAELIALAEIDAEYSEAIDKKNEIDAILKFVEGDGDKDSQLESIQIIISLLKQIKQDVSEYNDEVSRYDEILERANQYNSDIDTQKEIEEIYQSLLDEKIIVEKAWQAYQEFLTLQEKREDLTNRIDVSNTRISNWGRLSSESYYDDFKSRITASNGNPLPIAPGTNEEIENSDYFKDGVIVYNNPSKPQNNAGFYEYIFTLTYDEVYEKYSSLAIIEKEELKDEPWTDIDTRDDFSLIDFNTEEYNNDINELYQSNRQYEYLYDISSVNGKVNYFGFGIYDTEYSKDINYLLNNYPEYFEEDNTSEYLWIIKDTSFLEDEIEGSKNLVLLEGFELENSKFPIKVIETEKQERTEVLKEAAISIGYLVEEKANKYREDNGSYDNSSLSSYVLNQMENDIQTLSFYDNIINGYNYVLENESLTEEQIQKYKQDRDKYKATIDRLKPDVDEGNKKKQDLYVKIQKAIEKAELRVANTQTETNEAELQLYDLVDPEYYLQTLNYEQNKAGLRFDLHDGELKAYSGFKLMAKSGDGSYTVVQAPKRITDKTIVFAAGAQGKDEGLGNPFTVTGATFSVTAGGRLTATNADIQGKINATSGKIGGWTITETQMFSSSGGKDSKRVAFQSIHDNMYWVIAVGVPENDMTQGYVKAPFRVGKNGDMYASAGEIGGITIKEKGLSGSGWSISSSGGITANSLTLYDTADGYYKTCQIKNVESKINLNLSASGKTNFSFTMPHFYASPNSFVLRIDGIEALNKWLTKQGAGVKLIQYRNTGNIFWNYNNNTTISVNTSTNINVPVSGSITSTVKCLTV